MQLSINVFFIKGIDLLQKGLPALGHRERFLSLLRNCLIVSGCNELALLEEEND